VGVSANPILLSIITVNLNNACGLRRTLASLGQVREEADVECIFVDGGSGDESVAIAKAFYEARNIIAGPDRGIYDAMNKGFSLASGRFVLWLNSGDELLPDAWNRVRAELRDTESSLLVCNIVQVCPDGASEASVVEGITRDMRTQSFPHPATFFLTESVRLMGGYSLRYKISGDRDLILRILVNGGTVRFGDILVSKFYLGGISSNFHRRYLENIEIERRLRLISIRAWSRLYVQHQLRHWVVIPVWRRAKGFFGLRAESSALLKGLKRLFRQPVR
jgi:putative colanic acid biosynthesis glycosyltransferase